MSKTTQTIVNDMETIREQFIAGIANPTVANRNAFVKTAGVVRGRLEKRIQMDRTGHIEKAWSILGKVQTECAWDRKAFCDTKAQNALVAYIAEIEAWDMLVEAYFKA